MADTHSSHELMVFLFSDLVDSTGWKETLGDVAYAEKVLLPHNAIFRKLLQDAGGVERNFTGDGFLATFNTPSDAVQFALQLHRELCDYAWASIGRQPETRIAIHLGEAIAYVDANPEQRQISGQAVDLTARIMGLAVGRQTLLTRHAFDSARQYVRDEQLSWLAHGQYRCKGNDDPLEVCEVGIAGQSPLSPPLDSDKAKRIRVDSEDDTGSWRPAVGLAIPRRDGWKIEKQLGAGGFGEVWLARHAKMKGERVFKFCFEGERLRSFKRELTFFKLLRSNLGERPDIAKLYEINVDAPPYYLESEYAEPGSLSQWAKNQGGLDKIPLETRLRLIEQIARATAAAHSLGIIHKDLKPSNVLIQIDRDGKPQPQLNDFGIGVLANRTQLQSAGITETGFTESIMFGNDSSRTGTRLYSPPEASLGKPATTGTDIYALGVMLFQMVAGDFNRPLGTGWQDFVIVESVGDGVRAELLREDITTATHGDLLKRLSAAADLAERIANLEKRREERLAEQQRQDLLRLAKVREQRVKRLRAMLAGSVVVLALMGAMAVIAWQAKITADTKKQEAETALGERDVALGETQAALNKEETALAAVRKREADLKYNLGNTHMMLANVAYDNRDLGLSQEYLDKVPLEQRKFEWAYCQRQLSGGVFTLYGHIGQIYGVAFSPDGRRIVTAGSHDRSAKVWDAKNGQPLLELKGHSEWVFGVAYSPDSTRIVTGSMDRTAKVWNAKSGQTLLELKGHSHSVSSVAFSPDGTLIVTGSFDQTVRVWDAKTGLALLSLIGHSDLVLSVAFSPDGTRIVTGSKDQTALVWDASTGQILIELRGHTESLTSVAFSPDGTRIVTGSGDQTALVWDVSSGQILRELSGHKETLTSVAFSPDGTRVVSASDDRTARVWDAMTGAPMLELIGHRSKINAAVFSPDGTRIVTGSDDCTAKLWNARTEQPLLDLRGHTNTVSSVAISKDGRQVITGSNDATAKVWDAKTGQLVLDLQGHTKSIYGVTFSTDGTRIATGSDDMTAKVWDATSGQPLLDLKGHRRSVSSVAFSQDGNRIVTGSSDETAKVWDANTGQPLLDLAGHRSNVSSVAFSQDGKRILTGSEDATAKVWDATTGLVLLDLKGHEISVNSVAFSNDGTRIVTGGYDRTAKVWDANTGQPLLDLKGHAKSVNCVAFSTDGTRIVTGSDDQTAKVWDANTGQPLLDLKGHIRKVNGVAFSTDGARIVTGSDDQTARVWDAKSVDRARELRGHSDRASTLAFSFDDTQIVVAGESDKTAVLLDAKTGETLVELKGHTDRVSSVAISPNGMKIVTGSFDKSAKVWDAITGQPLLDLRGHSKTLSSVAFSADGTKIVTGSLDNTAKVWDAKSGQVLLDLKGHANVGSVAFSPKGTRVVMGFWFDAARMWDAKTGREMKDQPIPDENKASAYSPNGQFFVQRGGDRVVLVPTKLNSEELEYRLFWTAPKLQQAHESFAANDESRDPFAKCFHLDRLLSFPQNFGNVELLTYRSQLTGDTRHAARAGFHTSLLAKEEYDSDTLRQLAVSGDRLAQRLVAQELVREGSPEKAVPLLFWSLASRMLNSPPVEELLIANAYQKMNRPEDAKKYYDLATEWLDRPRNPMRAANVVTHALNPWNALGEAFKPIDDPRHNTFDWESWYECDVFRAEVEAKLNLAR